MDDRNPNEIAFDSAVGASAFAEWDRPWSTHATPDGIRYPTNGAWRVYHNCPAPKVGHQTHASGSLSNTLECSGCGQTFTYQANGREK